MVLVKSHSIVTDFSEMILFKLSIFLTYLFRCLSSPLMRSLLFLMQLLRNVYLLMNKVNRIGLLFSIGATNWVLKFPYKKNLVYLGGNLQY
jgi:hypothetical protein